MNERPTPETNAMRGEWAEGRFWPDQGGPLVQVEDAERLERERDEAREQAEKVRAAFERCKLVNATTATFWREDDEKMREAIREAREAIEMASSKLAGWHGLYGGQVTADDYAAGLACEKALAKLQPFLDA